MLNTILFDFLTVADLFFLITVSVRPSPITAAGPIGRQLSSPDVSLALVLKVVSASGTERLTHHFSHGGTSSDNY